jgi:molybdate transport system substrate-binding protein
LSGDRLEEGNDGKPDCDKNSAMILRSTAVMMATALAGLGFFAPAMHGAPGTPLKVLVSNGMKAAMEELGPQCERVIGRPLDMKFHSTAALKKQILTGDAFDVAIITSEAIDDLVKAGKLSAATRADLARSDLGIGIRAGAKRPDIKTAESLKQTLRKAASITYPQDGASRGYIENMFERLGIAAEVKPRIILAPGSGPATESVAAGKAEMVITLFSEIMPIHGVEILGALPGAFHYDVRFAAAASSAVSNAEAARAFIAFLTGPAPAPVYKAKGLISAGH